MGQKSGTETIVAILKAFTEKRQWTQADLARRAEIASPALRKRLIELQGQGFPLTVKHETPHAYWSVPKNWFPGGVIFTGDQVEELFRLSMRLPKGKGRDALTSKLLEFLPTRDANREGMNATVPFEATEREERVLPLISNAMEKHVALDFRYFSPSSGNETRRFASVHRLDLRSHARFIATCHRTKDLRTFRVDNISDAKLDPKEPFLAADPKAVDALLRESLDGFHGGGALTTHVFVVQSPADRWVQRNLIGEMKAEKNEPDGIRVTIETTALSQVARFVVGLGSSAKSLTPELAKEVEALARGALSSLP